jgi:meso-butanediol dehydrogenase/(S,S)-butanediol dehydrogenase/diacetyl reductase
MTGPAVIITGGGTGIGQAAARLFAKEGAHVLIVGRTAERLKETADGRPEVRTLVADVTAREAPELIVDTALELFGRIDVLVNNAAIIRPARLGDIDRPWTERVLATNLLAPLYLAQAAAPHMRGGGVIVNVTSNPPGKAWPGNSVYGATKVALDFLTHTWAVELGTQGIRVVSVAPGPTDTEVLLHAGVSHGELAEKRRRNAERIPLGRQGTPEEIAWWIVTAARPGAFFMTGTVLRVDGGLGVC